MSQATSVLVIDDDQFVNALVSDALSKNGFLVESALSLADAATLIEEFNPNVLVTEIAFQSGEGILEFLERATARDPELAIVALTNIFNPRLIGIERLEMMPIFAYLNKRILKDYNLIIRAVNAATKREHSNELRHDKSEISLGKKLSKTQLEAIRLVSDGLTNQQIADLKCTTKRAVEVLLNRAYLAMNLDPDSMHVRVSAVRRYLEMTGLSRH